MNPEVAQVLEESGLRLVGKDDTGKRIEVYRKRKKKKTSIMHKLFLVWSGVVYLYVFWFEQVIELHDHPFYVGVQFHPEFKSRPTRPSPLFLGKFCSLFKIDTLSPISDAHFISKNSIVNVYRVYIGCEEASSDPFKQLIQQPLLHRHYTCCK